MSASESHSAVVMALAEEFLERYRQGQRPSLKEYLDRHPELAGEIKEVFPAMALMENIALDDESLTGEATGPETAGGAAPPEQLGDYRILREVGRGGMGIVYEAEQVSLGRHVALKVLPRKVLLDDAQKRRFEREAKAAAKLHHTNIVPVFGVGEHDGLPYYVMQFIQGLGLDDVLMELKRMQGGSTPATGAELRVARKDVSAADVARSLLTGAFPQGEPAAFAAGSSESSGKLSDSYTVSSAVKLPGSTDAVGGKKASYWQSVAHLGVQVADALEYAHKQGIQHRDIKPSNLLLDTAGTLWVTDFGLARADNEDHLTNTGDIVGTLRYMPPEAFEGRADKRGDIYSLGLTLYEMLAFQPAFAERERHRLIKRVTTEEPARLDKLNRAIPRDLVTIIHKAIDREPSRRYATAGALAADMQRFLDDEPIQARRISSRERLARWCRHHPGVATLTAILVLFLIGVTAVSLLAAAHFDRVAGREAKLAVDERLARQDAEQAKEHEAALRNQADEAKKQAETNFAKAQKAVDDYFTTVSESQLLQVSGMHSLRRDLLQSALKFYQDFLKERGDDPALRGELAAAFLRVGKIRGELGEGAEARKACERAQELYEALTKAAPDSVQWRHGLAECYYLRGRNDEAIALWEKLVQPGQPRYQKDLAEAYNIRAVGHYRASRVAESLQAHQKALDIREMLVRLNSEDADAQRDLGATLNNIGNVLATEGRRAEALAMYRRAAEHVEVSFARAPQMLLNGRYLAIQQRNIAGIERQLGHVEEALTAYRRGVEVWRKMARDNPAVPNLHNSLFGAYRELARYQRELNRASEAARTMRLALETIDRLPSDGAEALYVLACVRASCSAVLGQGGSQLTEEERAESKHQADLAMEALQKAVASGFRDNVRMHKEGSLNSLRGRRDFNLLEADLSARLAADLPDKPQAGQPIGADPQAKRLRADGAAGHHAIALALLDLGKIDEAQSHLQQAVALRETLVKDEPKQAQFQADLTASRLSLESVLILARARQALNLKHPKEAETALAKIAELSFNDPGVWKERGRCYFALGQTEQAAADFRKAAELLSDQAETDERPATAADKLFAEAAAEAHLKSLTAAVERKPEDMGRRQRRGEWYARHMRWKLASADLKMALERQPPHGAHAWMRVAPVLAAGDPDGYRWLCREMFKRFGDSKDPAGADRVAKACLLLPQTVEETERAALLADRAVELGKNLQWMTYYVFCKGLADYRRGNHQATVRGLEPHLPRLGSLPHVRASCHMVLAMALHRQGQAKAARDHLARGVKLLDRYVNEPGRVPMDGGLTFSHEWVIAWLLHREAQTLIEGKKAEPHK